MGEKNENEKKVVSDGITQNDNAPLTNSPLAKLEGKTVEQVTTAGGKPKPGAKATDPLAAFRQAMASARSVVKTVQASPKPSIIAQKKALLSAANDEMLPLMTDMGQEMASILVEDQLAAFVEDIDRIVGSAKTLVDKVRATSAFAATNMACRYVASAWAGYKALAADLDENVWRDTLAMSQLAAQSIRLGLGEEKNEKPFVQLPLPDDNRPIRSARVRFVKHDELSTVVKEWDRMSRSNLQARNNERWEKQNGLWEQANSKDLLAALVEHQTNSRPVKVAFRVPTLRKDGETIGGCRVALVELRDGAIYPLGAEGGGDAWCFNKAKDTGVSISITALSENRLNLNGTVFADAENDVKAAAYRLHDAIKRAVEKCKEQKAYYGRLLAWTEERQTIAPTELETKVGKAVLHLSVWKPWSRKGKTEKFFHIALLVESNAKHELKVEEAFSEGDGQKFMAKEPGMRAFQPLTNLTQPFADFYQECKNQLLRGTEADENGDDLPENAEAQANERQAEAEAELEAARAKVAELEAKRVAAKTTANAAPTTEAKPTEQPTESTEAEWFVE